MFGLARFLAAEGVECLVAAPSKLQRPFGEPVHSDSVSTYYLIYVFEDWSVEFRLVGRRDCKPVLEQPFVRNGGNTYLSTSE